MYWDKLHFANCLVSNKAPVSYIEDVLVFSKNYDLEGLHPLRDYFKNLFNFIGLKKKNIIEKIGQRADHCFRVNSSQFGLCTEKTYLELIEVFNINFVKEFKTFKELKDIEFKYQSRFNTIQHKNQSYF